VTYAFDSSAILRYLDDEAGAERVAEIMTEYLNGKCHGMVSAIHWGEIAGKLFHRYDKQRYETIFSGLMALGLEIVPATAERAVRAGLIKVAKKIPYADAFGVELAASTPECVLVTADFDVKPAEQEIKIEFLPKK
jgi:predicted nucleic acid-binding protein